MLVFQLNGNDDLSGGSDKTMAVELRSINHDRGEEAGANYALSDAQISIVITANRAVRRPNDLGSEAAFHVAQASCARVPNQLTEH